MLPPNRDIARIDTGIDVYCIAVLGDSSLVLKIVFA
jgi:hypothetical protein